MSFSKIVITGTVTKKPERRYTATNIPVCNIDLIVTFIPRGFSKGETLNLDTKSIKVVAWRELAEECAQTLNEQDKVLVSGRLQINTTVTPDGKKIREPEVEAVSIVKLEKLMHSNVAQTNSTNPVKSEIDEISNLSDIINSAEEIPF